MSEPGMNEQSGADGAEANADQRKVSPGAQLAAFREERAWTVEQVASQLNLAPRQIAALERDDYPALPGMPIVRGFIRAYAKLLKVDPAPLLVGLGNETVLAHDSVAPRKSLSTPFSETRLPSMMERPGLSSKWVFGGLLAVLLGVAIWAARHDGDISVIPKSAPSQVKDDSANVATPDVNSSQLSTKTDEPNTMPPIAAATNAPEPVASTPVAPNSLPTVETPVVNGKDTLQFKASQDSWIEIRRVGNNAVVFSRILKAGETDSLEVNEPLSVVIGNVAGVEATLRGNSVELKSNNSSNVARLNLK